MRDIILGFHHMKHRFGIAMLFAIGIVALSTYNFQQHALATDALVTNYTNVDFIFYLFRGVDVSFIHNPGTPFPFIWLMIIIMSPFIIGDYARFDIHNQSSIVFVRVQHRISIWFSKLFVSILVPLIFYIVILIIICISSAIFYSFSFEWGEYSGMNVKPLLTDSVSGLSFAIQTMLLPLIISVVLSIIQTLGSVFVNPVYMLLGIIASLIASVFSTFIILPGSYGMIDRYYLLDGSHGISLSHVLVYSLLIISLVVIIGYFYFQRMDIMGLRGD